MPSERVLRVNTVLLAVACVAAPSVFAADSVKFDAGLWEQTTEVSLDGRSWKPAEQEKACLSETDAAHVESEVRRQIAAGHCKVDRLSLGNGRISGAISCPDIGQLEVKISGEYTPRAYSIDVDSSAILDMSGVSGFAHSPIRRLAKWKGRLVGPC